MDVSCLLLFFPFSLLVVCHFLWSLVGFQWMWVDSCPSVLSLSYSVFFFFYKVSYQQSMISLPTRRWGFVKFLVWFCLVSATTIVKRPPLFPKAKGKSFFYQWFYETFLSMHTKCTNLLQIMCIQRWVKRRNYLKSTLRTLLKFL